MKLPKGWHLFALRLPTGEQCVIQITLHPTATRYVVRADWSNGLLNENGDVTGYGRWILNCENEVSEMVGHAVTLEVHYFSTHPNLFK